ncbi:non-ribosomal peptide synthetase [Paenibacillus alvei]|uniref:non-ribosomal peptide synthetase n=1 Tax=Paenibacillus alvei TaxID=44250 RepID=UPI0022818969|nr:non-ribosomal peptide synthetase [Paenibacillus alvei]
MNISTQSTTNQYELSHTQKRFWFLDKLDFSNDPSARAMSHVSTVFTLVGPLEVGLFKQTVQDLAKRHAALRTSYRDQDGSPLQLVFHDIQIPVAIYDISADDSRERLEHRIQEELNTPFDLQQAPLIRFTLYKLSADKHICMIVAHHSIVDGLSIDIILSELMVIYKAHVTQVPPVLPELDIQYSDYAHWHNGMLTGGELADQRQFWADYLAGELLDLNFPLDYQRPAERTYTGAAVPLVIGEELFVLLKKTCEQLDVSLYMFLLGIMNVLLAKYTRNQDIIVGTSLSGRFHPDLNGMIGSFINTLPVRNQINGEEPFSVFVKRIKENVLNIQENQAYPFDMIVHDLGADRNNSHHPVYDVVFEMHTLHADSKAVREISPGLFLSFEHSLQPIRYSVFDFIFELYQKEGQIEGYIQYATHLFESSSMERLSCNFLQLVQQAIQNPTILVSEMDMLSEAERTQVMEDFNQVSVDFPVHTPFPRLFEQQVVRTPNHIAASYDGEQLSYRELNERANRLAHFLRSRGIKSGQFVAVMCERNLDWLTSLLAILKSGAAYVPIDPNVPDERATYILQDCAAELLITQNQLLERVSRLDTVASLSVLCVDMPIGEGPSWPQQHELITSECLADFPVTDGEDDPSAERLAYMIYTSGSTGTPKGALVRHNGMINHLYAKIYSLQLSERDIVAQNASISFDVSIWQSLIALLVGGQTSIVSFEAGRDQALLLQYIKNHQITVIETVPSLLFAFLDTMESMPASERSLPSLRWMIANGEELPGKLVKSWFTMLPDIPLINAYGPTECSDDVTQYTMRSDVQDESDLTHKRIPVGKPLPNMRLYVVDQFHKPVPVGVKGEIWISGIGVGAGYWHNDELTHSKFIANPFANHEHERIVYRTGDLGCWLPNGNLEFSSRIDHQVKVRGFRIELGEVEAVINRHPGIDEAAVIARKQGNGDSMLVTFYTSKERLEPGQLRTYLQEKLPYYMVPAQLISIEQMPLLTSEKIDRKTLQSWANEYIASAPSKPATWSTPTERELSFLWAEILELKQVDAQDHFFHLGGHSISAVKLVNRIRKQFGISMALQQIFTTPVLHELAAVIDQEKAAKTTGHSPTREAADNNPLRRFPPKSAYALAPVQLPEWYLHELEPDNPFYNVSFDLMFYGDMNLPAFEWAWQRLIERHSVLRTHFANHEGATVQVVKSEQDFRLDSVYENRTHIEPDEIMQDVYRMAEQHNNQSFDFAQGPLFSVKLIEYADKEFLMMFVAHHIIWDETSSMNLIDEFSELYNSQLEHRTAQLPELEIEYTDYAEWMNTSIQSGYLEAKRQYWLDKFAVVPPALDLPTDYPRPSIVTFNGGTVLKTIQPDLQKRIATYCQQQGITLYMFLLSVLNLQMHRLSNQDHFAVGSPIVNRDDVKLERMLGLFATAILLECRIEPNMTFAELVSQSRQTAIEAYDNHLYPSNFVIEQIRTENDLSRSKLFSVMYGLQNNKQNLLKNLKFVGLDYNPRVYDFMETSSRFDLTFAFDELGHGIELNLNYNTDLFKRTTAERIAEQFILLTQQVIDSPDGSLYAYEWLDKQSETIIANLRNRKPHSYEAQSCVHQVIERQVELTPNEIAIFDHNQTMTYKQMNEKANQLAHLLLTAGVRREQKIGVRFERSADLIVSLLAVWKAGAAYVPIHPELPEARQLEIIQAADISVLITGAGSWLVQSVHPEHPVTLLDLNKLEAQLHAQSTINPGVEADRSTLAYVLFTSGTTGKPKGIEIEHQGIVHLFAGLAQHYSLQVNDTALFHTSYSFDASLLEIFWPLTCGARIFIPHPDEAKDPAALGKLAEEQGVAFLQFVPLMLEEFINARRNGVFTQWPELRFVISGGAPLTRKLRDLFREEFDCGLYNHYGPTEVTVDATTFDCRLEFEGEIVPIGSPLGNVMVYVLDRMMNIVPAGVPGELYISSPGLARGYLHDPERTADSFVNDPFSDKPDSKLYKTGDLVKYTEEGIIRYIGRLDQQVKVRGNRVELEEVEAVLMQHRDIASAAVVHRHDKGMDGLVAYVEITNKYQPFSHTRRLKWFNLAQMPQLAAGMNALHRQSWPDYFIGDSVMLEHWPKLFANFTDYQFALLQEDGEIAAVGNTVPMYWDGLPEHLPQGWDEGLLKSVETAGSYPSPNTLLILAGVVNEQQRGNGLAGLLLEAFKYVADAHQLEHIIVPVRPTGKTNYPEQSFTEYCALTRSDGLPLDPWLRTHIRAGGQVLSIAEQSQTITGSIRDWQLWTGIEFPKSGSYITPITLQPVMIDLEQKNGIYYDPSVWVQHFPHPESGEEKFQTEISLTNRQELSAWLRSRLPGYMVPQEIIFVANMPLTSTGKIDKVRLSEIQNTDERIREIIPPQNEEEALVLAIWQDVLQLDEISVNDNFFELGGHSLKATAVVARIGAACGYVPTLRELFEMATVRSLAQWILQKKQTMPTLENPASVSFKKVERRERTKR